VSFDDKEMQVRSALGATDADVEVAKRRCAAMAVLFPFYCIIEMDSVWKMRYALAVIAKEELGEWKKLRISGILLQLILCKTKLQYQYSIALLINN
jgi:hypothetical protein